jgi:hypothetical protein
MIATCFGRFIRMAGTTATMIALASAPSSWAQEKTPPVQQRIGVYDSRAVAVAYAGSTFQVKKMKELTAQLNKARETGDTNRISQLETAGRAWQSNLHRQGFGTAPVDDILAEIASDLPKIQEAAGVTRLVSRWNKAELNRYPKAAQIDVTMQLVDAFQPNITQRKRAVEIQKTKPQKIKAEN